MADGTGIQWTDATWPIVQGCDYESPGCAHCYAVNVLWRLAHNPNPKISAPLQGLVAKDERGYRHFTGEVQLREDRLYWPMTLRKPRRIFVPSHGDLFHDAVPDDFIDKVFGMMWACPQHQFQVLTKRAARMMDYTKQLPQRQRNRVAEGGGQIVAFPLPNVWLGVSVEDRARLERLNYLRETPATVRFVSIEPLLEDLGTVDWRGIHWAIVGGESGPKARPFNVDWAASLRDQCKSAGVAFFLKQLGTDPWFGPTQYGPSSGHHIKDRAGADWDEWPAALRVREFPV